MLWIALLWLKLVIFHEPRKVKSFCGWIGSSISNPKPILWERNLDKKSKFGQKVEKNPSVIPLVVSNLKCVQIGFYFPKFLKFPKIYFYFCVIIIFGWSLWCNANRSGANGSIYFTLVPILSRASSLELGSWRARWMAPSHWLVINITLKMKGGHLFVNLYIDKHIRRVYIELDV